MSTTPSTRRRWFQYGLGKLLISTAIVAVGFALIVQRVEFPLGVLMVFCGAAIAGSGLLMPFRRPILGASLGIAAMLLIIVVAILRNPDDFIYWLHWAFGTA
jgi:hypothetical protein